MNIALLIFYFIILFFSAILLIIHLLETIKLKNKIKNFNSFYKSILFNNQKELANFVYLFYLGTLLFSTTIIVSLYPYAANATRWLFALSIFIILLSGMEIIIVEHRSYSEFKNKKLIK